MKILVIEDDRTVGRYVVRGLEEHHYTTELAVDGRAGLDAARAGTWDLIILDLRLPVLSGLEVLRTLRDGGVATPILVLTAQDTVEGKVDALRTGADDYVTKPFAMEELIARVEALGRLIGSSGRRHGPSWKKTSGGCKPTRMSMSSSKDTAMSGAQTNII